jgi:hypothetical protein
VDVGTDADGNRIAAITVAAINMIDDEPFAALLVVVIRCSTPLQVLTP